MLVKQRIRTQLLANFINRQPIGNELVFGGHINPIDIGVFDGWRGACDKNFFGSRVAAHLYDLLDGIATDDRIVDEQDVAPLEFKRDCVEFAANGFLAL